MARCLREVAAEFLQRLIAFLRVLIRDILLAILLDRALDAALRELELPADGLHFVTAITDNRQQQMLRRYIVILHRLGQLFRPPQHAHHIHAHAQTVRALDARDLVQYLLQPGLEHRHIRLAVCKDRRQQPLRLLGQREQYMR